MNSDSDKPEHDEHVKSKVARNDSMEARDNSFHLVEEERVLNTPVKDIPTLVDLVANMRMLVNNPTFSDVIFLCNDGERVHASRLLLAGRSDVLKSMLISGMAESSFFEIKLPTISSPVLLCVLEFLYTGRLFDHYPCNWKTACEVIDASQFFLLPKLDIETRKFMFSQISSVAGNLPAVASLLTEAMEWNVMRDETDVSLKELVTILSSNWSEPSYIQNLSEDAFYYLLAGSKIKNDDRLSFEEYLRFRQVMRWWFCQSDLCGEVEALLDIITLDEQSAASIYENVNYIDSTQSPTKNILQLAIVEGLSEELRNSVIKFLSNIDFRKIHPILLATVVEPLKVVSSTEIQSAFRCHALRNPKSFLREPCEWNSKESYVTFDRGFLICHEGNTTGVAVMMAPMSLSSPIYKWSFYVEELPHPFFELGFTSERLHVLDERLSEQDSAKSEHCSRRLRANPVDLGLKFRHGHHVPAYRSEDPKQRGRKFWSSAPTCITVDHSVEGVVIQHEKPAERGVLFSSCGGRDREICNQEHLLGGNLEARFGYNWWGDLGFYERKGLR